MLADHGEVGRGGQESSALADGIEEDLVFDFACGRVLRSGSHEGPADVEVLPAVAVEIGPDAVPAIGRQGAGDVE